MDSARPLAAILGALTLAANSVLMLADRAPGALDRLARQLDGERPRAVASAASHAHGSDWSVHALVWGVAAVLLGLAAWSWGSALFAGAGVLAYSLAVEAAQPLLTASRELQLSDMAANALGTAVGLAAVVAWGRLARRGTGGAARARGARARAAAGDP